MNLEQELQRKSFAGRVGMMVCRFGRVPSPAGFGEASGLCRKNEGGFRLVLSRGRKGGAGILEAGQRKGHWVEDLEEWEQGRCIENRRAIFSHTKLSQTFTFTFLAINKYKLYQS